MSIKVGICDDSAEDIRLLSEALHALYEGGVSACSGNM